MGLLITFLLGLFILLGAALTHITKNHRLVEDFSIALALGTMVTLAITDLIPEAVEHLEGTNTIVVLLVCVAAGIVLLKVLDRFIPDHDSDHSVNHECTEENAAHIGIITTIAVTLHNLIEGMAVYSVATESLETGLLTALGVGLHNIPMGIIIASTLESEARGKRIAFLAAASLSTFVGGVIMASAWGFINDLAIGVLISITLGMIAYIVFFELLPHIVHRRRWVLSAVGIAIGVAIVFSSALLG